MKKLFGKIKSFPWKKSFQNFVTKFKENKKFRIISIVLAVLIVTGSFFGGRWIFRTSDTKTEKVYAQVSRGAVTNVIEGTGTVEAISQYEITSLAKGDVIADYFEVGDYVIKDQLLYEIDSASVDKSITRQQSNVEKAAANYSEALEDVSNLSVKSTISGVISNMYVSVGDSVQQGAKIADVINKDSLEITLPFGKYDAQNIQAGSSASVTLSGSLTTITGVVTKVATGSYVNSYGVEVTDVEIEFSNPGTVSEGETVSAVVGDYACYDTAQVQYIASKTITAKTSGEVKLMYKGKGDAVRSGEAIVLLESSAVTRSSRDAQMSLQDANLSLEDLYDNLEDYSIKSPIDGKVIQKNIKAGEKLDSNSSTAMAIIADLSKLTFEISIDELDISKISVGQPVSITADALPGQRFTGEISNISIVGSAYQGVTSYPVTVTIDNTQESDLIPGMNVSAQIIVDSVENVLRVPVSAIHMGNLVIVKDDGTFADPARMLKNQTSAPSHVKENEKQQTHAFQENDEKEVPASSKGNPMQGSPTQGSPEQNSSEQGNPTQGSLPQGNPSRVNPVQGNLPQIGENAPSKNTALQETDGGTQAQRSTQQDTAKSGDISKQTPQTGSDANDKAAERIKTMIDNLDVPAGYTVVMVETGLTDGTYIEIKEIKGSLKEGDQIILSVVSQSNSNQNAGGMFGGMGGMPGGMGGMPGGMGANRAGMGGMPGGMGANRGGMSGMSGGMGTNRGSMR